MAKKLLDIFELDKDVVGYDFASHHKRKKFIQNFLSPKEHVNIIYLRDLKTSILLGVARVTHYPEEEIALFTSLILNPDYIENAEAWMVYFLPSIIASIRPLHVSMVYTNLPPTLREALGGYLEYGFQKLDEDKCFKSGDTIFSSLYFEMKVSR
jgi:Na+/H+ antiporter NhaB